MFGLFGGAAQPAAAAAAGAGAAGAAGGGAVPVSPFAALPSAVQAVAGGGAATDTAAASQKLRHWTQSGGCLRPHVAYSGLSSCASPWMDAAEECICVRRSPTEFKVSC